MSKELAQIFCERAIAEMRLNVTRLNKTLDLLTEVEVWQRPNAASNSIGNLLLHLSGNIEQWILSALGGAADVRIRAEEFEAQGGLLKSQLMVRLEGVIDAACQVIEQTTAAQLVEPYTVQGFRYPGLGVILHVVEHLSYHVGQVAYWAKAIKDTDLGFYADHVGLNDRNAD